MLSRTRRSRPRPRFALESLESRTLLSTTPTSMGHALFSTSYASLHLRPAQTTESPTQTTSTSDTTTSDGALPRLEQAQPPAFLESLNVVSNADGTSAATIDCTSNGEAGTFTATARWDGGVAKDIIIDQPGEFGHPPTVGAAYMLKKLGAGEHTLEVTVTNADRGVWATTSTVFTIASVTEEQAAPDSIVSGPDSFASPDGFATDSTTTESTTTTIEAAPTVTAVYVSGSAWWPEFKDFLQAQAVGDATYGYAIDAGDQLNELPWVTLDTVSVRFSEDVEVSQSER